MTMKLYVGMASKEEGGRALSPNEPAFAVGDRVEKMCIKCGEERGHIVASISKKGRITRVSCPICGSRVAHKGGGARDRTPKLRASYDRARPYRRGQTMMNPTYGEGEVLALIEPQRIDVLFADRVRRYLNRVGLFQVAVNKDGEYVPAGAIVVGPVDELKGATLIDDNAAREQVQPFFTGITESRNRAHKLQTEINRLKKKTQAIIDKLA